MDAAKALEFIRQWEGCVPWLYLDKVGKVTVGVGNMLPTAADACTLRFIQRIDGAEADNVMIVADFERVKHLQRGLAAPAYRAHTMLELPEDEILRLFARRVREFTSQLNELFPDYITYPESAQLALLDMAFSLGTHGVRVKFPRMCLAVEARSWSNAADECARAGAQPARNLAVKALFIAAAAEDGPSPADEMA